jgi:cytochrome c
MKMTILVASLFVLGAGSAVAQEAQGDAAAGETVFKKCAVCHSVGEGATNKVGPILNDLFGRTAGTEEGFKYSQAMIDAGKNGLVWTPETFGEFIHDPKAKVPGTKMAFPGLKADADVANVTAYLLTLSPDYKPAQ